MRDQLKKVIVLNILLLVLGNILSFGQSRIIHGRLINALNGNAIQGASISVKQSGSQSSSNASGEFYLSIPDTLKTPIFTEFPGMEILEIKTTGKNSYEIYLSESNLLDLSFEELLRTKVNVSSTKSENVFHTPSTVSVIGREMINQYNFMSVAEMLRITVGIDIYQTNNDDNVPTARGVLQNYYANKILVMIENIPTYQPIYGNTNLDRLDVNDIERIEVLKGPASVLYGSNAYLGVINIILRKDGNGDVNVRIEAGYPRMGAAGGNVSMSKNDFKLFISGNSGYEIQNPYELTGKRQDLYKGDSVYMFQREIKSSNFNIHSGYKSFRFLMNTYEYQHTFQGINPSFISGGGKPMTDRGTLLAVKFQKENAKKFNLLADLAYDYFKRDYASNQDGSTALMLSGERLVATLKLNYTINSNLDIEAGVDAEKRMNGKHVSIDVLQDTVLSQNLKNAQNINEISAFTQLHYKTRIGNILGGVRYTNNSFSGENLSGRVSLVTDFSEYNSIKLIYGQSYRAPTMLELFFNHPTVVGNIKLKPEKAKTLELAFVHGHHHLFFQVLGYYHKLDDLIQRYTPSTGPPSKYQNLSTLEGYGFELEAKYQKPEFLNVFFNYNYMNGMGQNALINYQLVPNHTFKAGLNKSFGDFFASVNAYAITSVMGNPKMNKPIAAQFMMDGHIGYKQTLGIKKLALNHILSAKNLTSSQMLIPEYIRQTDNINSMATAGSGIRLIYTLTLSL